MARTPRWKVSAPKDGVVQVTLSSWKYYADFISQQLLDYRTYIYRGHTSDIWKLESTLDRALKVLPIAKRNAARASHLANFTFAARGRRGPNPRQLTSDTDWWALGQHNGLVTPLLDWTESPFVALYFSFEAPPLKGQDSRAVWALAQTSVIEKTPDTFTLTIAPGQPPSHPTPEIVRPMLDENPRLVSQRGLFVWGPDGVTIDDWIRTQYQGDDKRYHLIKIRIPSLDRPRCLRFLNRMNINHLSLFPDLYGASTYCNMDLQIDNY